MKGCKGLLLALLCASGCLADPPLLVLYPRQLQFPVPPATSATPTKQSLIISNDTHADMEWSSKVVTSDGGTWLSLTPSSGTVGPPPNGLPDGPTSLLAYASVATGLKAGVYTGSITITASRLYQGVVYAATDSPQTVNVTYTVYETAVPAVRVSTNAISVSGVGGIGTIQGTPVAITNAGPGTLNWSAAVAAVPSAPWLTVSPSSGVNAGSLFIAANPAALTAGVYTGLVTVSAPGSPTQTIIVTNTVRAPKPATLDLITSPISFTAGVGANPPAQTLAIANSGELVLNWRASASTFNGGQWLSVAPAAGTNSGTLVITPNASTLTPGVYAGRVTVSNADASLQAQIQVNLTIARATPSLTGGGFYNAASLAPDGVVAGSIASIFGSRLGKDSGSFSILSDGTGKLPTEILGTRVTIDGVAAPLFYASGTQINLQIPYEAAGKTSVTAHIEAEGYDPADFKINLAPANVGVFTLDGKRAAALNQDGKINSSSNPAAAGSVVQLFATGQGVVDMPVATGLAAPSVAPFPTPIAPISVQIGGLPAKILFSGLAPGAVGMIQLNVEIPAGIQPSDLTTVQTQTNGGKPNLVYISTTAAQ